MKEKESLRKGENMTFRALYLLAIVFVVDGHSNLSHMFDMGRLFRYYSFHLLLFAFGAGYFFRSRESLWGDIAERAKKLLVPLYVWNAVYGLGAWLLRSVGGFEAGAPVSLYTLLIAPLTDGQHFAWNLGSWFIFPLFLVQVCYCLIRRAAGVWKDREIITFILCLIPGFLAISLCRAGKQEMLPLFALRSMILLPGYAGGQLYRRCLEKHDRLATVPYLTVVVVLRALLCTANENMAYLLSDCTYFPCNAFVVYAGGALAIAFWLRIARMLAPHMEKSRLALYASRHTFDIMMHHLMGFFAVNTVFLVMNAMGTGAADFSVKMFRTEVQYSYAPQMKPEFNVIYLIAGMLLPLGIARVVEKIKSVLKKTELKETK